MLDNFSAGGAAINQLCATYGLGLKVFDLAIDQPTAGHLGRGGAERAGLRRHHGLSAWRRSPAASTCSCVGEMGIGNTTIAAAIYHALYGGQPQDWVGRGTGLDDEGVRRKTQVIGEAVALHRAGDGDPLEVLRRLGGREIAAMAGAILAARHQRVPVILDGFVTTAAAAVLHAIDPRALDHCLAGHCLGRAGRMSRCCAAWTRRRCSISACGSAKARARRSPPASSRRALACWRDMATFDSAGVAKKDA